MTKTILHTIIILVLSITQSCITEDFLINTAAQEIFPVRFSTDNSGIPTRTNSENNHWVAGDSIGIYMLAGSDNDLKLSIADNRAYRVAATGNNDIALIADAQQTIFYPSEGEVNFIAYYPYKPTGNRPGQIYDHKYPVDVSRQENMAHIDILYGKTPAPGGKSFEAVSLAFEHKLTKIVLYITTEPGVVLQDMKAVINGMPSQAFLDLNTGTVTPATEKKVFDIFSSGRPPEASIITEDDVAFEAIVIPHTVNNPANSHNETIQFTTTQQKQYTWDLPDGLTLESKNIYVFRLSLKADPPDEPFTRSQGVLDAVQSWAWTDN